MFCLVRLFSPLSLQHLVNFTCYVILRQPVVQAGLKLIVNLVQDGLKLAVILLNGRKRGREEERNFISQKFSKKTLPSSFSVLFSCPSLPSP